MKKISSLGLAGILLLGLATPSNAQAPTAVDDSYALPAGDSLVVDAPGVLDNDKDAFGENLPPTALAELLTDVAHGTLTLASDGSFEYIPPPGFVGFASFTYRAVDGGVPSNEAIVTIEVLGCSGGPTLFTCWIESAFATKLAELGYIPFYESCEDDVIWGPTRSPSSVLSVNSQGVTWTSNHADNNIATGNGPARTGSWGVFSEPHGDPTGNPFDPLRDGIIGTADGRLVAAGGWFESNTGGAQVAFALDDGLPIGFNNPRLSNSHRFFGVINTGGFTKFEVYETEGVVQDQKFIFADDFVLSSLPCSLFYTNLVLTDRRVSTTEVFEACESITAGPNFIVDSLGDVTFRAQGRVILQNGFSVLTGGKFVVEIIPNIAAMPSRRR